MEHGDGGGDGIPRIVELVAACCHSDAMYFCFVRSDVADEVGIGDFASLGDLGFRDKKYGTSALDALRDWAVDAEAFEEESAPFVGESSEPSRGRGAGE